MHSSAKNIIIVDDDQDDLELFELALKETCPGYLLHTLSKAESFISFIIEIENPQLVILDLNMPVFNGKDCLRWIRNHNQLKKVPVIVLSTSANKKDIEECLGMGANQYIVKPYNYTDLKKIASDICSTFFSDGEKPVN
jgi:DNA-binding response OmpR family regulator